MQFLRTFKLVEYKSLAESTVLHLSPGFAKKGGGLAFSGILESILNFGALGPMILGIFLGSISLKIQSFKYKNLFLYQLLSVFFLIICMKLIRTELAVILKIYVLPMTVAYYFFYKLSL